MEEGSRVEKAGRMRGPVGTSDGGKDVYEELMKLRAEKDLLRKENAELKDLLKRQGDDSRRSFGLDNTDPHRKNSSLSEGQTESDSTEDEKRGALCVKASKDCSERKIESKKVINEQTRKNDDGAAEACNRCPGVDVKSQGSNAMHSLSANEISRYSRQLLVPAFGVAGQERLLKSTILVVGCGGLGSPIALYLAGAGIGCLGLVDHDVVEISNLHRQVIHTESSVGMSKVKSAAMACSRLNSSLKILEYHDGLNASNAIEIVSKFDVVVDATDNLPSRYLINDACVAIGKPLVSGAALGLEGQVSVYNEGGGPCYRCLFPVPPPEHARQRCSDNGVIGIVPGIIGTLQALEALKLASGVGETLSRRMVIFDALSTRIRVINLRAGNPSCAACGVCPQITSSNLHEYDYTAFTRSQYSDEAPERQHIIPEGDRISAEELRRRLDSGGSHVLVDVRDAHEYAISALPNSINIPYSALSGKLQTLEAAIMQTTRLDSGDNTAMSAETPEHHRSSLDSCSSTEDVTDGEVMTKAALCHGSIPIYVVCRRGNDSQRAVCLLRDEGFSSAVDVMGGLESWVINVDKEFPFY